MGLALREGTDWSFFNMKLKRKYFLPKKVLNGPALDYVGDFQEVSLPQVFE